MRSVSKRRMIGIAIGAIVVVFACGFVSMISGTTRSQYAVDDRGFGGTPMLTMTAAPALAFSPTQQAAYAGDYQQGVDGNDSEAQQAQEPAEPRRIVIRNATISITVEDTQARVTEITAMAEELGGWVVSSSTSVNGGTTEQPNIFGSVTIRVPAASLDMALTRIRAMATIVNNEQISGQDVTQDYVDAESRLRNLEAAEQQLQTIMDAATNVQEVMTVYNQLVSTRSEIEVLRGRLQYWDQASTFSAISITLNPVTAPAAQPVQLGWNPLVTVTRGIDSLVRITQGTVDVLIMGLMLALPLVLIFGLPTFLLWRRMRSNPLKREVLVSEPPQSA